MEKDFLELKAEFSAGRIQAYPDFDSDEPFILTTDRSSLNIAGVLSQKQEGVERFLGCWGRKTLLQCQGRAPCPGEMHEEVGTYS